MTFFSFLLDFLVIPVTLLTVILGIDRLRRRKPPQVLRTYPASFIVPLQALGGLVFVSLWANCLINTHVWAYNLSLAMPEYLLGNMPIEVPALFGLVTVFCGLWLFWLAKRVPMPIRPPPLEENYRWQTALPVAVVWLGAATMLVLGVESWAYLCLQLVWALPVIALELAFGADILWRYPKLVVVGISGPTLYLWMADAIAVGSGLWTISPDKSFHCLLGGMLPAENLLFYLLFTTIAIFGMTLWATEDSQERLPNFLRKKQPS